MRIFIVLLLIFSFTPTVYANDEVCSKIDVYNGPRLESKLITQFEACASTASGSAFQITQELREAAFSDGANYCGGINAVRHGKEWDNQPYAAYINTGTSSGYWQATGGIVQCEERFLDDPSLKHGALDGGAEEFMYTCRFKVMSDGVTGEAIDKKCTELSKQTACKNNIKAVLCQKKMADAKQELAGAANKNRGGGIADADKPRETETETDPDLEADPENVTRPPADEQVAQAEADYKMYESQVNECKKARDKAEHCCGSSAMGCMMGFKESDDMGAVTSVGAMLIQQVIATRQISQGVQGNCNSQEGLANFSAGVNGAMAMSCHGKRTTCDSTCEPLRESIKAKKLATCTPGRKACEGLYDRLISDTQRHINKCDGLIAQEVAMGTQAVATVASGQMARLCQDVVAASPPPVAPGIPGNDLCTDPTDLSNPYCRQQFCSQPGSINLPECQGQQANTNNKVGGGGGPTSFGSASFGTRGGNADLGGADDGLGTQQPGTGNHEIGSRSAVTAQAGGSGGVPGGGATGGGGAGYGGGGARQKGLKTDILGGVGGGSGYSVSRMGVRGGGGYSNPVGRGNGRKKNKPFDLKKYLPKKDAKRKLAGLSGKRSTLSSQLAGKHENIWSRVSNKYKEMCILNRLYCPRKGRR